MIIIDHARVPPKIDKTGFFWRTQGCISAVSICLVRLDFVEVHLPSVIGSGFSRNVATASPTVTMCPDEQTLVVKKIPVTFAMLEEMTMARKGNAIWILDECPRGLARAWWTWNIDLVSTSHPVSGQTRRSSDPPVPSLAFLNRNSGHGTAGVNVLLISATSKTTLYLPPVSGCHTNFSEVKFK